MVKLRFDDELIEEAKQTAMTRVTAEAEADAAFAALRTADAPRVEGHDDSHAREYQVPEV